MAEPTAGPDTAAAETEPAGPSKLPLWRRILVSVLVPLALFFIFEQWFRMLLPKGVILEYFLYRR